MKTTLKGLEFDPGFAPYILAFRGTVEYLYMDINKFKNLSQKKMRFKQYYKKILELFYNNIGFYTGCLMWAAYISQQPEQEILSNDYYGCEYNESENISDTQFLLQFTELFPKDMKYFLSENFEFDSSVKDLLSAYEKFLVLNKGFTITKNNTDIKLPKNIDISDVNKYKELIDEAIKEGNLNKLAEVKVI